MIQEDWIESANTRRRGFLRPGSILIHRSIEGNGHKPGIEDYPFQGLDVATESYDYFWLAEARNAASIAMIYRVPPCASAGEFKHPYRSPLSTPVAQLTRQGHDMLAAPCGYCGRNLSVCKCGKATEGQGD
jgi:hypothetical protein